ncbi:lycopene cyclase family protein [Paractinoplanes atraurantiacus]|uniref:Lycopene beta-cyclase n=1 Tax=Paractinoplanes atraurantiacus TaxID=1036182 RepID=A0A285KT31_9ACTN|nr:lycopene cyclase family protein [Actinoplanes atraurantiacus]SNY75007.1 lycopene beta-cyclase [Actinoplanes atraurantiacus]
MIAPDVDLVLVGGGGAASLVLAALGRQRLSGVRLAIVDPVRKRGQDRTWAFWGTPGTALDPLLSASWDEVDVVTPERRRVLALQPLRYAMLRSAPLYELAAGVEERLGAVRITAPAGRVVDDGDRVVVTGPDGNALVRAGWALDSRPRQPARPGRTNWLQHFRGWWLEADAPVFDPGRAVLMDFRTPQPARGVSFGYVLPVSDRFALVEYTEFSPAVLDGDAYDAALRAYADLIGLDLGALRVREVEDGVIPMTDGVFDARPTPRVVRLGTAGGATRPSTGFTFSAMARQAEDVARALADGRPPVPKPPYPARHRWMDAVQLRALDRGLTDGVAFFDRLFDRNPAERVLRFLDGTTSWAEDLSLMASSPLLPMTRAAAGDAVARISAGRRPRGSGRAGPAGG